MSHECDGDCRATAEWRQQQIRDLTERLNRVKALAEDEKRHLVRWIDGSHLIDLEDLQAALGDAS